MHIALVLRPSRDRCGAGRADRAPLGAPERAHQCTTADVAVVACAGAFTTTRCCFPPGPVTTFTLCAAAGGGAGAGPDDQASTATIASIAQTESTTTQTRCMISHLRRPTTARGARALAAA